ncbi:hypothetical protein [Herbaspirillum rubrisubalbicans]|uniref:FIST domain-containing protein n=1 Tax=Herbaspirillum rubrisubalbicans TaxID=80842 RepID=A0ABX9BYV2_9BURK|nr:hypothetical protein [Herbaspirillum rubrisubalbicans]RAM63123.1 hypothetical protein RB24_17505 [Herbaspirillum rubrisubalbicans]
MKADKYLVLIHFAAKITRANLTEVAKQVTRAVRDALQNSEAICSTASSVAFVGESRASADSLFRLLASDLRPGDNLSIFSLGQGIATSHSGLHKWATRQGAIQAAETGDP